MDDLRQRESLYAELGKMLAANQFVRFVLEQALRRLAAAGTQRLLQLSSGRYSFAAQEDDFYVVDHENADQQRSVHTLSGGESFLASLALALALAEGLAEFATDRESLRLESLFLDEGFSTLDAETLDVVVQGIETLADRSRLVGVSSHVSELAERLPARIRVQKSPAGSRVAVD
jgi:exonuclease SbcC